MLHMRPAGRPGAVGGAGILDAEQREVDEERPVPTVGDEARAYGPWTYQRLVAATPQDSVRREIIDGWLYIDGQHVDDPSVEVAAESALPYHGDVVRELMVALLAYRRDHDGQVYTAPVDVAFGDQILQPDVFWLPRPAPRRELPVRILPDLVIEVSSPSTRGHDLVRKRRVYEQAGVPEYWFVDTDAQRFECYSQLAGDYAPPTLTGRGGTVRSAVLDGLEVVVDEILGPEHEGPGGF